ncbi:MAG TPA: Gfo/Idh/MocA family oxidoreductase [Terracidiphilus sp.]|jgi:predicted dehydrogenase|nr:Gfo/Idh/MocA family oxidoreductase [Terracidiphilus sp.]
MIRARISLLTVFLLAASALSAQSTYTADAAQPLRVAIVGLEHGHVEGFLAALPHHQDVELVGIADADSALLAKYQQKYNLPASLLFTSEAGMIEARRPQAVLVYTSIAQHRPAIDIAAQYGVNVMVEKPLTISLDDALHIRDVARKSHIQVLTNYETTWYASNRAAYDLLQSNRLGDLRKLVVHDGHQGPKEIGVPPEFLKWLTDPAQAGAGALYDFGCYGVDLTTWLMHGELPQTVTAILNHDKRDIYRNVDDDATILLQYPHAQAVIMASWNWPFARKDMEVYGATGYAITVESTGLRVRYEHDRSEHTESAPSLPSAERDSLSYLAAVLSGKINPRNDLSSLDLNVKVMQILDAARQSAKTGESVRLNSGEE